jgi:hypothetical protein
MSNFLLQVHHYPNWITTEANKGQIMIFNNGLGRSENFSSIDMMIPPLNIDGFYQTPNNGESFLPINLDWQYIDSEDPLNFYSKFLSSAQRLPNGNTLICEGTKGHFFEINNNKEIIWEYINPDSVNGTLAQGDRPTSNPVFRAIKYPVNHPAFTNKTILPKDPIELNFNIGTCK